MLWVEARHLCLVPLFASDLKRCLEGVISGQLALAGGVVTICGDGATRNSSGGYRGNGGAVQKTRMRIIFDANFRHT